MSNDIWFTSDTHFFHNNIIKYCDRPFSSVQDMNATLIRNWNFKVKPEDTIFHLGDFSFGKPAETLGILRQLNGHKILIEGNHDWVCADALQEGFDEVHEVLRTNIGGLPFHLYHFPIHSWDRQHHGSIHVHGHVHSMEDHVDDMPNRFDVGVDHNGYFPVNLKDLQRQHTNKQKLKELKLGPDHEVKQGVAKERPDFWNRLKGVLGDNKK